MFVFKINVSAFLLHTDNLSGIYLALRVKVDYRKSMLSRGALRELLLCLIKHGEHLGAVPCRRA